MERENSRIIPAKYLRTLLVRLLDIGRLVRLVLGADGGMILVARGVELVGLQFCLLGAALT